MPPLILQPRQIANGPLANEAGLRYFDGLCRVLIEELR